MAEALAQDLPPLKRGDRFAFSFYYDLIGNEDLLAIYDGEIVIGTLDGPSYDEFLEWVTAQGLDPSSNFIGRVRQRRASGDYAVDFDVDQGRLYILNSYKLSTAPEDT